ncbi:MAG: hypothetical protein JO267_15125 [Alphaproteobacteria bacterium]|nr:hypothetical protein [Alphaproteobacteria bacterium]
MDLRPYGLTEAQIAEASALLNYQPFRISDAIVTGVAHFWLYGTALAPLDRLQMVFDAARDPPARWHHAVAASEKLDRLYQCFVETIVELCPGGSYLDLCCNTGYFPVLASLRGMTAMGVDGADFSAAVALLNGLTGARAGFRQSLYQPTQYAFVPPIDDVFDIVSCMAFVIHVPEPLHLLRYIAERARHAVFLWSAFPRDDAMTVRYPMLHQFSERPFPWGFDAGVAVSDSLLIYSMQELGFPRHFEVTAPPDAWPPVCGNPLMAPYEPLRAFVFTRG